MKTEAQDMKLCNECVERKSSCVQHTKMSNASESLCNCQGYNTKDECYKCHIEKFHKVKI